MELFKLLGTVAIETSEANKNIDDVTEKAEESEGKLTKAFEKIGAVVATAFAVDKIADFGIACANAAADAGAVASQFAQVFGEYGDTAGGNLDKIADDAGISVNRMKSSYTKIAAFAKTTGMATADAMALADRALVAVADSAAFYDRSLEETTESLQSFLKGNFENDAALGLSCTETTRNAKANELYGQSFQKLSESQKQLTLLAMVEDANKLSGAIGQASRESDTWTNQTGNLAQAWTDFKAAVGVNFLEPAIEGVKLLTGAIEKLTEAMQWLTDNKETVEKWVGVIVSATTAVSTFLIVMNWGTIMSTATKAVQAVAKGIHTLNAAIAANPVAALISLITGLISYMGWLYQTNEEFHAKVNELLADIWEKAQGIVQNLKPLIENVINAIRLGIEQIKPIVRSAMEWLMTDGVAILQQVWQAILDGIEFVKPIIQSALEWLMTDGVAYLQAVWQAIQDGIAFILPILQTAFETISSAVSTVIDFIKQVIQNVLNWFEETFKKTSETTGSILDKIKGFFQNAWEFIKGVWEACQPFFDDVWESIIAPVGEMLSEMFGAFQEAWNAIKAAWDFAKPYFQQLWQDIQDTFAVVSAVLGLFFQLAWEAIKAIWDSVAPYFNVLWEAIKAIFSVVGAVLGGYFKVAWETIKAVWNIAISYFTAVWAGIRAVFAVVAAVLGGDFERAWELVKNAWEQAGDFFGSVWDGIVNVFSSVIDWFAGIFDAAFNGVVNVVTAHIEALLEQFSNFIDNVKEFFNFEVSLPHVALPHFSISPSGWELGDLLDGVIPELGIEWYAKGGVMDEPTAFGINGRNLMVGGEAGPEAIAPIAVLQEYIAQAVAAQNMALVAVLERILEAILSMDENMGGNLRDALEGTAFEVNKREFARLVKAVN